MKIVLISAPYLDVYGTLNVGKNHTFSLGVGYVAAVLRDAGHQVSLLDPEPLGMSDEAIKEYLKSKEPDLVGISSATANFKGAIRMAHLAKEVSNPVTVIGGVHASALPLETLRDYPEFDLVAIGEGEETMGELCSHLETEREALPDIKGIAYRDNGRLEKTQPRPLIQNLDQLPFPAREMVDLNLYRPQVHLYRGRKSATILTSRGCPALCTFCATTVTMGNRFRKHSPEYVLSEIRHLITDYGIQDFVIVDDTFTIDRQRAMAICNQIIEQRLDIGWFCFARVDNATVELYETMKKAGCFSMFFGIESADPQVLKNIKKGATVDQARYALRMANKIGFKTEAGFMLGNPGDTRESIKKTISLARELNPVIASFNIMTPFPGTEEYAKYLPHDPVGMRNWDNFVPKGITPLIKPDGLSRQELQKFLVEAYLKFYLRPQQLFRILRNISSWAEFKVYLRGGLGLFRRVLEWIKASKNN